MVKNYVGNQRNAWGQLSFKVNLEVLQCYKLYIIISKNQRNKLFPKIFVLGKSNIENLQSALTDIGWFSLQHLTNQCQLKRSEGQKIISFWTFVVVEKFIGNQRNVLG